MTPGASGLPVRAACSLIEVLLAVTVLTLALSPLLSLLSGTRKEAVDADTFVALLERVEEEAAVAFDARMDSDSSWPLARREAHARAQGRELTLRVDEVDSLGVFAPPLARPPEVTTP
ncbi:MAG: hypothetical protein HY815_10175 [Candidatus Riflebacteria bacterium]|nr:hypothetical protein [Candidatus Riflebacteria bacterium]